MEIKTQTGLKNFKPKINLNHNSYKRVSFGNNWMKNYMQGMPNWMSPSVSRNAIFAGLDFSF